MSEGRPAQTNHIPDPTHRAGIGRAHSARDRAKERQARHSDGKADDFLSVTEIISRTLAEHTAFQKNLALFSL